MQFDSTRGLIFDLDGLLVDSEPLWFQVEGGFLAELGHIWTKEQAEACMGQGTPNTLRIWQERFGVVVDIPRDTETIIDRMIARASEMTLMPGVLGLLDAARRKGWRMAIASSSPRRLIEAVAHAKGISPYFEAIASGQEVPRGKPAPDVFLLAARLIDVPIENCVVLEDALAGVKAAHAAGSKCIAVPSVKSEEITRLATVVLKSLEDAPAVLNLN